ncbi:tRNA 5-methylaminomethyl-2-thiouridine biosynthesis bifunctional protein [Neisseria sp. HSC-16F19]|nr:FAD-dependent 5-carboxymethylaminomethyl-2-thiouridine(34) oxidoreductase MnmC [Neisseria sp. HSC-16F19]MCP2040103.1 tRNA 5-methylaminomethyl-2-thiouridine biosynthesis bifunctional protein [Neisseria sp. HSC-16F19]
MNTLHAWHGWPELNTLAHSHQQGVRHWLMVADHPPPPLPDHAPAWQRQLEQDCRYHQQQAPYLISETLPGSTLLWLPENRDGLTYLAALDTAHIHWHTPAPILPAAAAVKPWLALPPPLPVSRVLVVGAGIAGAATAYALARRGVAVTVLERHGMAQAASGNRQGLLYAKISAHPTAQTRLLLAGYAYSRQLLEHSLPDSDAWQACGVLHMDDSDAETRRNRQLAEARPDSTLYRAVDATEASELAGIPLAHGGLWWPHGAWVHPRAWVAALLAHPLIEVREQAAVTCADYQDGLWTLGYSHAGREHAIHGSHIVLCGGADSTTLPLLQGWPLHNIRGQTATAAAGAFGQQLRCALSGSSYIAPAWQGQLCFGASFVPGDNGRDWRDSEHQHNLQQLTRLHPRLAADLGAPYGGHAAVRADSYDHLPLTGPVGDTAAMRLCYAKLAADKHYRLHAPCPWLPGVFANTAHSSRGLSTAPLCAEAVAAALLGEASPLHPDLQQALHPNRLVIRSLTHHQPWPQT